MSVIMHRLREICGVFRVLYSETCQLRNIGFFYPVADRLRFLQVLQV